MTITAARKQAAREITMSRIGGGYVIGTYDHDLRAIVNSREFNLSEARYWLAESRRERAEELVNQTQESEAGHA